MKVRLPTFEIAREIKKEFKKFALFAKFICNEKMEELRGQVAIIMENNFEKKNLGPSMQEMERLKCKAKKKN